MIAKISVNLDLQKRELLRKKNKYDGVNETSRRYMLTEEQFGDDRVL